MATGGSKAVLTVDLGAAERAADLLAVVRDPAGNVSPADTAVVNLDFTAPRIVSAVQDGSMVTVTFDEPLASGRDAAFDWNVRATQGGESRVRPVSSVTGSGDTRILTVSEGAYDPTQGDVTAVIYNYRGPDGQRYTDRATNLVPNLSAPVSR